MTRRIGAAAIAGALAAIYLMRLDRTAGMFVDDAWYMVLAKAIAQGKGYRMISSATGDFVPAVPPAFPMLLSPVWALWPSFPGNVIALKSVSMLAMFGTGMCTYLYLRRVRNAPLPVVAVVAALTVALPAFVFLATSTVMADVVFVFTQLLGVLTIERAMRKNGDLPSVAASGLITGVSVLVRTAGVACAAAGVCYFASRRQWRSATIFAAMVVLSYLPWAAYAVANRSSNAARLEHGGSIAFPYAELIQMRHGGEPASGWATIPEWPRRFVTNLDNVLGRDVGAIVLPAMFRGAHESGQEVFGMSGETGFRATSMGGAPQTFWVSMAISAIGVIGLVRMARDRVTMAEWLVPFTVVMVCLVPALTFRYVVPLAPFVLLYFFAGLETIAGMLRRHSRELMFGAPFRIAAACIVVLIAAEHTQYIWAARRGPMPLWLADYQDVETLNNWLAQPRMPEGQVVSNNPGLVYLWTGRRGLSMENGQGNWQRWTNYGVRYAVAITPAPKLNDLPGYQVIYDSKREGLWIATLEPSPSDLSPRD